MKVAVWWEVGCRAVVLAACSAWEWGPGTIAGLFHCPNPACAAGHYICSHYKTVPALFSWNYFPHSVVIYTNVWWFNTDWSFLFYCLKLNFLFLFSSLLPADFSPRFPSPQAISRADFVMIITHHNWVSIPPDGVIRQHLSQAVLQSTHPNSSPLPLLWQ